MCPMVFIAQRQIGSALRERFGGSGIATDNGDIRRNSRGRTLLIAPSTEPYVRVYAYGSRFP